MANILRSLANDDPDILLGRQRIGGNASPFVKISRTDGVTPFLFNQAQWNAPLTTIHIFDEEFINTNVYSGMDVTPPQRSAMHDLINGPKGASFQKKAQSLRARREQIREKISNHETDIRKHMPNGVGLDVFIDLQPIDNLPSKLSAVDDEISAFQNRSTIGRTAEFKTLCVPKVNVEQLEHTIGTGLDQVADNTMAMVRDHLTSLRIGAETWIQTGLEHYNQSVHSANHTCPFCLQSIINSPIFEAYQLYFGDEYKSFTNEFQTNVDLFTRSLAENARTTVNSSHEQNCQLQVFWETHGIAIDLLFDIDKISTSWTDVSKTIDEIFTKKRENNPCAFHGL